MYDNSLLINDNGNTMSCKVYFFILLVFIIPELTGFYQFKIIIYKYTAFSPDSLPEIIEEVIFISENIY